MLKTAKKQRKPKKPSMDQGIHVPFPKEGEDLRVVLMSYVNYMGRKVDVVYPLKDAQPPEGATVKLIFGLQSQEPELSQRFGVCAPAEAWRMAHIKPRTRPSWMKNLDRAAHANGNGFAHASQRNHPSVSRGY